MTRKYDSFHLCQEKYVQELLSEARPVSTPMSYGKSILDKRTLAEINIQLISIPILYCDNIKCKLFN